MPSSTAALLHAADPPHASDPATRHDSGDTRWTLEWRGVRYSIEPADRSDPAEGLVCEPPIGGRIPGYLLRSEIHRELQESHPGVTLVFTDASRSALIRRWGEQRPRVPITSREIATWPEDLEPGLAGPRSAPVHGEVREGHPSVEIDLSLAILTITHARLPLLQPSGHAWRLVESDPARYGLTQFPGDVRAAAARRDEARALGARQLLQDLVTDPAGPEVVRALWRTLRGLRVLDPACGTGDRLLVALDLLTWIYEACLDQMRIWVDEIRLERRTRRAEFLRDFRAVLGRAEGRAQQSGGRGRLVAESIVLLNLFGADVDPRAARRCASRLHSHLRRACGPGSEPAPPEGCNVAAGALTAGIPDRAALARALVGVDGATLRLQGLLEEAEAIDRADRFVRRMRLEHGADTEGTAAGFRAIRRRRRELARQLDPLAARASGLTDEGPRALAAWVAEHRPLHHLAEWPPATRGRAFHVIADR